MTIYRVEIVFAVHAASARIPQTMDEMYGSHASAMLPKAAHPKREPVHFEHKESALVKNMVSLRFSTFLLLPAPFHPLL